MSVTDIDVIDIAAWTLMVGGASLIGGVLLARPAVWLRRRHGCGVIIAFLLYLLLALISVVTSVIVLSAAWVAAGFLL